MLQPRFQFAYPYYRPETPEDHYRNNVFLERAFNNLPQAKLWHAERIANQFGLVVGDEIPDATVTVSAEVGEQFLVDVSGLFGLSQTNNGNVPPGAGIRGHISLYAYRDSTEFQLQRVGDLVVPSVVGAGLASPNLVKFGAYAFWRSDFNGVVRFYMKVSFINAGYVWIAAGSTVPLTMTVTSYGVGG